MIIKRVEFIILSMICSMSFNVNIKISQEVFDAMKRLPRERYDVLKTLLIDRVSLLRNFPKI